MSEVIITVTVGGRQHTLGFDETTKEIFFDGGPALIRSAVIGAGSVTLLVFSSGEEIRIESKDFYRLLYGGSDPNPSLVGSLLANNLLREHEEVLLYSNLAGSEITLKSTLPCAYEVGDGLRCMVQTRKAFIADCSAIPGSFVILPCCKEHVFQMQQLLAGKSGMVGSSAQDGDVIYPVGREG